MYKLFISDNELIVFEVLWVIVHGVYSEGEVCIERSSTGERTGGTYGCGGYRER